MDDRSTTRRRLLRLGGFTVLAGVAGCSGGGGDGGDGNQSGDGDGGGGTATATATSGSTPTDSGTATATETTTAEQTTTAMQTGSFSPAGKLVAEDGGEGDRFGARVGIDGDRVLVTSTWDKDRKGKAQGSAYVFEKSGGSWSQQAKFIPGVGEEDLDGFGYSASLVGDTALVGAATYDPDGPNSGAAYVFQHSGGSWSMQSELTAGDPDKRDLFGATTALSQGGDLALVGSVRDEDPNGEDAGSAYVFTRSGGSWSQQTKLTPDDGDSKDGFGGDVDLAGTTAVVGASGDEDPNGEKSGAAYVFTRSGGSWSQQAKLTPDDGDSKDSFGVSVALSGDTALVGAARDEDPNGDQAGAVYAFQRSGGSWSQQAKFAPDDGDKGDVFGASVALAGNTAVVGTSGDEDPNGRGAGSAYVFVRSGGSWSQQSKLAPDDGEKYARFGTSVALDETTALVGANFDDNKSKDAGAAYVFER